MPPMRPPIPRGSFVSHSRHLRQKRLASTLPALPEHPVWRGQDANTKLGASITGAMEWQTSTYCFNKQNEKTIPVVSNNLEKLIEAYVTIKKVNNEGKDPRAIRTALATRRKSPEKVYVSKPRIKDFGDRVEVTAFVFDGQEAAKKDRETRKAMSGRAVVSGKRETLSDLVLDTTQQKGLQTLIARLYGKPAVLKLIKLQRPQLDAGILAAVVAQRLRDRRNLPRRVIRDATWKATLPTAQRVEGILRAKHQRQANKFSWSDFTMGNTAQTTASSIVDQLALSQVASVQVEASGRLTKRLTADRSMRKMARRGATSKAQGYMLRGFRKAHIQFASATGKRKIGQYGIRVTLGHA